MLTWPWILQISGVLLLGRALNEGIAYGWNSESSAMNLPFHFWEHSVWAVTEMISWIMTLTLKILCKQIPIQQWQRIGKSHLFICVITLLCLRETVPVGTPKWCQTHTDIIPLIFPMKCLVLDSADLGLHLQVFLITSPSPNTREPLPTNYNVSSLILTTLHMTMLFIMYLSPPGSKLEKMAHLLLNLLWLAQAPPHEIA